MDNVELHLYIKNLLLYYENNYVKFTNSFIRNVNHKEAYSLLLNITDYLNFFNPSVSERIYCFTNNIVCRPKCKTCNNQYCNFCSRSKNFGYSSYCSTQCVGVGSKDKISKANKKNYELNGSAINQKRKNTLLKKYNVDNPIKIPKANEKRKETLFANHGVSHPLASDSIKEIYKTTCLEKFGVENPSKNDEIKKKKEKTTLKNYGVSHHFKDKNIKERINNKILEKYGVSNPGLIGNGLYSKISQELFWKLYNKLSIKLQEKTYFAELNKEFDIFIGSRKQFIYDFVITNIKLCIEFNGDKYHANPKVYNENSIPLPQINKTSQEIWDQDKIKLDAIENLGYKVIIVWESDYKLNKDNVIKNLLEGIYDREKNFNS